MGDEGDVIVEGDMAVMGDVGEVYNMVDVGDVRGRRIMSRRREDVGI